MHFTSWTSGTILLGFILTVNSLPSPTNTLNSQNGQNGQLLSGELQQYQQHPLQSQVQGPSQTASSKQGTPGTFVFAPNPSSSNYSPLSNQPGYQQQIAPSYQGYGRDVSGPAQPSSSPFFGLASNGDFQLSAYFSTIFWGFVGIVVPIAAIIYLIRNFFPSAFSGLVKTSKDGSVTGKALDLERITDIVYRALEGKWAVKETRDGIVHGKGL